MLEKYLPVRVNDGPWITACTLYRLRQLPADTRFVLPICSLAENTETLTQQDGLLLPPLFHEAMDESLKDRVVQRIMDCFPVHGGGADNRCRVRIVEFPERPLPVVSSPNVLAFSVDTAVEEHGPHLPLGTDTIQSYLVLGKLAEQVPGMELFRPVDYGQLTWGLPFGFSIDLTAELLTEYVARFAEAVIAWKQPQALYVVDVHGSITHRQAIVDGLRRLRFTNWVFRWLHEPLAEVASGRGDQHAGGVETALIELAGSDLLDRAWFPGRVDELAEHQMSFEKAVELTSDLQAFKSEVNDHHYNGIIGDIRNYDTLDAAALCTQMLQQAEADIRLLREGGASTIHNAGKNLW
ncbi:MAG: creatininase family protein [Fuerstiella sp.]